MLFLKGVIIGIGKIIPGVSGAMLAINFGVYERLLEAITNFFDNWKENLKLILMLGSGMIVSIILFSNVILYLFSKYGFVTMLFFIGLIIGGIFNFAKGINYSIKSVLIIVFVTLLFLILSTIKLDSGYVLKNNFYDNIIYFLSGYVDMFASIMPGISGTSLLMIMGMYNNVLKMISMVYDYSHVITNIWIYFSFGMGIIVSFIINSYLVSYLIKKYQNICYSVILGLSIASTLLLFMMAIKMEVSIFVIILGIIFLFSGILLANIFSN